MASRLLLPVLLSLLLAGCDRDAAFTGLATAPPLPGEMQGDWIFSESATVAHHEPSMTATRLSEHRKANRPIKALGGPMGNIRVSGNTIVGQGRLIQQRFDLTSWSKSGGIISGRAWHHEDRHDLGDMHEIDIKLRVVTNELWLDMGEEGEFFRTIYIRIPEPK